MPHPQLGYLVFDTIEGANPDMPRYPLMHDDLMRMGDDGTWWRECPGMAVRGFRLTEEQEAALQPVRFINRGLKHTIVATCKNLRGAGCTDMDCPVHGIAMSNADQSAFLEATRGWNPDRAEP